MDRTEPVIEPRLKTRANRVTPTVVHPMPNDPRLQSTWYHRGWFATGCTMVLISLGKAINGAVGSSMWFMPLLAGFIGYILADLVTGVYHWAIDNYGDASTPFFGEQIEGFQSHHRTPWFITQQPMAHKLCSLAQAVTVLELPFIMFNNNAVVHALVGTFMGSSLFCQQFHSWSHEPKSKLPRLVVMLQDSGVLLARSQHAAHHKPPFNNNYCIVSGVWNGFLDKTRVFLGLEVVLFYVLGAKPRNWIEPSDEWTQEASK